MLFCDTCRRLHVSGVNVMGIVRQYSASVSANQPKAHFGPPWVRQTSYPEAEALSLSTSLIQPSRVNLNAVSKSIVYGIVATTRSP